MITTGMYTSLRDNWSTPHWLFDELDRIYHFDLDVCADTRNYKCQSYYSLADNGLKQCWFGKCWMNPPYGRAITQWLNKARFETSRPDGKCDMVMCLLPARTDTNWWHDLAKYGDGMFLLKGRLRFGHGHGSAPFPSVLVPFVRGGVVWESPTTWKLPGYWSNQS